MLVEGVFREKRGRRERGREGKKLQKREKGSRLLFPRDLRRYSCCGFRGLSRGAVRLSVAALVVEFRPSARPVKVVVGADGSMKIVKCIIRGNPVGKPR